MRSNPPARNQVIPTTEKIGLHGDADVAPVAKLGLGENLTEDVQGQVLDRVLLHVDVDERAALAGQAQDRAQTIEHGFGGCLGMNGIELAVETRQFD